MVYTTVARQTESSPRQPAPSEDDEQIHNPAHAFTRPKTIRRLCETPWRGQFQSSDQSHPTDSSELRSLCCLLLKHDVEPGFTLVHAISRVIRPYPTQNSRKSAAATAQMARSAGEM